MPDKACLMADFDNGECADTKERCPLLIWRKFQMKTKKWITIFFSVVTICLTILGLYTLHIDNGEAFVIILIVGFWEVVAGICCIS